MVISRVYKIIVYKILYKKIKQKNRVIQKKYWLTIETVHNVRPEKISDTCIELARNKYRDSCYSISPIKESEVDWYIEKQNEKSKKYFYS